MTLRSFFVSYLSITALTKYFQQRWWWRPASVSIALHATSRTLPCCTGCACVWLNLPAAAGIGTRRCILGWMTYKAHGPLSSPPPSLDPDWSIRRGYLGSVKCRTCLVTLRPVRFGDIRVHGVPPLRDNAWIIGRQGSRAEDSYRAPRSSIWTHKRFDYCPLQAYLYTKKGARTFRVLITFFVSDNN